MTLILHKRAMFIASAYSNYLDFCKVGYLGESPSKWVRPPKKYF